MGSRTANVLVEVSPIWATTPQNAVLLIFTTSVLLLYAVCVGGLECASDTDLNRHRSLSSPLAAVDVVCQSSAVWFSLVNQVLKQPFQLSLS